MTPTPFFTPRSSSSSRAARRWLLACVAGLAALAGCATPPPAASPGEAVTVARTRGAVQCGDRGTAPEAMRAELQRAGVRVQASACGSDGRMRPAVCGAGTDEINLFDIAAADLPRAQALGFAPLSRLGGDARAVPCR